MRLDEISAAQRRRQKAQNAIKQREQAQLQQQQELLRQQQKEKFQQERRRRDIAAKLSTKPPLEPIAEPQQPRGFFDDPAFDILRNQEQEDKDYGVDLKFETVLDKTTRTKSLYAYWTKHRIQLLRDVERYRQFVNLGNFQNNNNIILSLFQLFHKLGQQEGQVYIIFDKANMKIWPGLVETLRRLNDAQKMTQKMKIPFGYGVNPETNELEQYIVWEVVERQPGS